ncbi:MAG: type II toxin-antitoxin system HicA family toxin [Alphaproteobacteria bacterium]|jgi:predicted RNA binding protein YcfA (HicA-like mRNA interferase family)|nr:type II toxin-antitoxin system HicA family toxin [Alphaproteobacteria bacterium]MDP6568155.1 type II toxin-antitoxin system HicA family toxin [Alphaproteobacteria bacterium]MDP6812847.1 type II toxin-antitoxin system HicA family toxin [Alphaproteobacteria bacterium]
MTGDEFIRRIRKLGRRNGLPVDFVPHRGKGSHGILYYAGRAATVKDRKKELRKGLFHAMCKQLGIDPKDL